jgi:integrase
MSLYRRAGSDRWVSEITINGKRYRRSTGTSDKRAAREIEARWRIEILTGRPVVQPALPQVRMITVAEAVDRYAQEELAPRDQKPETARSARYNLSLIPAYFGKDTPLDQITSGRIADWRASMLRSRLAPASVNRRLSDLRSIMNCARSWGRLQAVPEFTLCKLPSPVERWLTEQEYQRLLAHCPDHLRCLVILLAGSGGRLGEVMSLRWSHVADDCSSVIFTRTKGGRSRCAPLTREAREMLASIPRGRPDQHVILFEGRPFESPKRAWQRARAKAQLPHVRIHDLRHFAAAPIGAEERLALRGPTLSRAPEPGDDATLRRVAPGGVREGSGSG